MVALYALKRICVGTRRAQRCDAHGDVKAGVCISTLLVSPRAEELPAVDTYILAACKLSAYTAGGDDDELHHDMNSSATSRTNNSRAAACGIAQYGDEACMKRLVLRWQSGIIF